MCLDVDVEHDLIRAADPKARKPWQCEECNRTIEPGERYHLEVVAPWGEGRIAEYRLCVHCDGTLNLGVAFTGCPKSWYFGFIHDLNEEAASFVADILRHDLTGSQRISMLRTVVGRRRLWRRADGSLLPVPA